MEPVSAVDIARAVDGVIPQSQMGGSTRPKMIRSVSIDTRTLDGTRAPLFVAVVATRDGHDFVDEAVAKGAAAILASRPVSIPSTCVIQVKETVGALQAFARWYRSQW